MHEHCVPQAPLLPMCRDTNTSTPPVASGTHVADTAPRASSFQWPQQHTPPVQRFSADPTLGRVSLEALEQAAERRVAPLPSAVPAWQSLPDAEQQRLAPQLLGVGRWGLPLVDFGPVPASAAPASAAPR